MHRAKNVIALVKECRRAEESCLYTSTTFFIWLRFLRATKFAMTFAALVCGSVASWKALAGSSDAKGIVAVCAFLAGLLPTLIAALKLEKNAQEAARLGAEFKNLQDRFRQAALVWSHKKFEDFEADFRPLMKRLEEARKPSLTPPELVFILARRKIKAGHYSFDIDETEDSVEPASA